ncbi:LytTR family DNA-binding domain-containing protein [uncultured Vagococcus sp.]|uniref:LytR/AlgR family response regulator transcription factor n=1 Tax=uncultured Vagococcus sp. TaxID=189676 RepID=UPI0028D2795A|nr:LytTR family DNA-binding domain-containing protein [uncultured Vagococcus sp.]
MKIVICEDEHMTRQKNRSIVETAAKELNVSVTIFVCESGEQLLFELPDIIPIDLLVLDIQMGDISGMDLAKKIREKDQEISLIFVSNYDDYVFDGYEVNAMGYVMKPLTVDKMRHYLSKVLKKKESEEAYVVIQFNQLPTKIYLYEIIYVESEGHYLNIVTQKGSHECKGSLLNFSESLNDNFVQVHRSYLVNLNFISAVHQKDVLLANGDVLPVSRNKKRRVKELFLAHYRGLANE